MDNKNQLTFFSYDAAGNQILEQTMITSPPIIHTVQNEYDANNQLVKTTEREGGTTGTIINSSEYAYNSEGQRVSKTVNGEKTYYYYQGETLLYTTDADGNKTSQNIVGLEGNIIATIRYDNGQHAYFYNKDIRTSVVNIIDESGNGVVSYRYDDFGATSKYGDEDFYNEVCYTSGIYDEVTEQYYFNARYYDSENLTFLTQDSYRGEQDDYGTWNLYAYCAGNPITYVDPSGHFVVAIPAYYTVSAVASLVGSIAVTKTVYDIATGKREKELKKKISKTQNKAKGKQKTKPKTKGGNIPTSKSFKIKGNNGRIDVEYWSNPQIHFHGTDGRKYLIYSTGKIIEKNGRNIVKKIRKVIESKEFHEALSKAAEFLRKIK